MTGTAETSSLTGALRDDVASLQSDVVELTRMLRMQADAADQVAEALGRTLIRLSVEVEDLNAALGGSPARGAELWPALGAEEEAIEAQEEARVVSLGLWGDRAREAGRRGQATMSQAEEGPGRPGRRESPSRAARRAAAAEPGQSRRTRAGRDQPPAREQPARSGPREPAGTAQRGPVSRAETAGTATGRQPASAGPGEPCGQGVARAVPQPASGWRATARRVPVVEEAPSPE